VGVVTNVTPLHRYLLYVCETTETRHWGRRKEFFIDHQGQVSSQSDVAAVGIHSQTLR